MLGLYFITHKKLILFLIPFSSLVVFQDTTMLFCPSDKMTEQIKIFGVYAKQVTLFHRNDLTEEICRNLNPICQSRASSRGSPYNYFVKTNVFNNKSPPIQENKVCLAKGSKKCSVENSLSVGEGRMH